MDGGLLQDVVIRQGASILKLFADKKKTLLVWRDCFLALNLGLDLINGARSLNIKSDRRAS